MLVAVALGLLGPLALVEEDDAVVQRPLDDDADAPAEPEETPSE